MASRCYGSVRLYGCSVKQRWAAARWGARRILACIALTFILVLVGGRWPAYINGWLWSPSLGVLCGVLLAKIDQRVQRRLGPTADIDADISINDGDAMIVLSIVQPKIKSQHALKN